MDDKAYEEIIELSHKIHKLEDIREKKAREFKRYVRESLVSEFEYQSYLRTLKSKIREIELIDNAILKFEFEMDSKEEALKQQLVDSLQEDAKIIDYKVL